MRAAGQSSWTNATHLLINDPEHPRYGSFLRGSDLGWPVQQDESNVEVDVFVVVGKDGRLAPHTVAEPAELFETRMVEAMNLGEQPVAVCTSLSKLLAETQLMSYE